MARYNTSYRKVRRAEDASVSLGRIGVALLMILISISVCFFVIKKINSISLTDGVVVKITEAPAGSDVSGTRNGMLISNNEGIKYLKDNGRYAKSEWIDLDGKAYYVGDNELAVDGEYKENGQIYTFDKGVLVGIKQDKFYIPQVVFKDKYSNVRTMSYDAFLDDKDTTYDNYFPIMLQRRTGSDEKIYLGGEDDKQFSSRYMLCGEENYLYYLALGKKENFAGKLFRVHLGQTRRESFGSNVLGYKVIGSAVYYCQGNSILRATSGDVDYIGQYLNKTEYSIDNVEQETTLPTGIAEPGYGAATIIPYPGADPIPNNMVPNNRGPYGNVPSEIGPGVGR